MLLDRTYSDIFAHIDVRAHIQGNQCITLKTRMSAEKFVGRKVHDIPIFAVDAFDQKDPSTATSIEEVCGPQGRLCWKINLICHILWKYLG